MIVSEHPVMTNYYTLQNGQYLLKKMLISEKYEWRNLSTLFSVIGCDDENTKNHLTAIGARGSEKNDGKWGMISRHSLEEIN